MYEKKKKTKDNAGKSKVMVFERREIKVVDFITPYKVSVPAVGRCEVVGMSYLERACGVMGGSEQ